MAITVHECPPAHTHIPAALTLGVAILPLGRSLCMPAKQCTENEITLNMAFTSNTQTPPPGSRHSFNRMFKSTEEEDGPGTRWLQQGMLCQKMLRSMARGQLLGWPGSVTQGSRSTTYAQYFYHRICTYLHPSVKEKEPESGSPGE